MNGISFSTALETTVFSLFSILSRLYGDPFIEIIISAPDSFKHSQTSGSQMSWHIGIPNFIPLSKIGPGNSPGINCLLS